MDKYIKDLTYVIQNGEMDNTYKMVWIRSIVETCVLNPKVKLIHFDQLSPKIFGHYWNQTIFFDLEQGPNPNKRPKIYQIVKDQVEQYRTNFGFKPEFFSKVEDTVSVPVRKISTVLKENVCWRFKKVDDIKYEIYDLNKNDRTIKIHNPKLIKEFSNVLFDIINYRWTQKLEELNFSPRISKKVRGTDREDIKRKSLSGFRKYLDLENPERRCFISGKLLEGENLSIDHVIPWSYIFSDDLWNLVYVDCPSSYKLEQSAA